MTSSTPETGAVTTPAVATPPRVPKLAAALQPSVPTAELAHSIESLAERADPGSRSSSSKATPRPRSRPP